MALFGNNKTVDLLSHAFMTNPKKFSGLYTSIERAAKGQEQKDFKSLDEFFQRVSYMSEFTELKFDIAKYFPTHDKPIRQLRKLCRLILKAMDNAGITRSRKDDVMVLDKNSVMHYSEWNGEELYVSDSIKIISPAWYQGPELLEKGYCQKI